jgi:hypothetical protein
MPRMNLNCYFRKGSIYLVSLILLISSEVTFSQKVYFPFHEGKCADQANAFYNRGLLVKTCPDAEAWGKEAEALMKGNCATVYAHAKVEGYGDKAAMEVVGHKVIEVAKNCNGGSSGGVPTNSNSQSSGSGQQSFNSTNNLASVIQLLQTKANQEIDRQRMVVDDKGPNKYSFIENVDQSKIDSDVIQLINGTDIKVIILNISQEEVTYKKATLPDGPTFKVKSSTVKKILLKGGKN